MDEIDQEQERQNRLWKKMNHRENTPGIHHPPRGKDKKNDTGGN